MKRNPQERKRARTARAQHKMFGTAERPRLSVFRSNQFTYVQLIDDEHGHTLASLSTRATAKKGESKTNQAAALGTAIAELARKIGVTRAVFDKRSYQFHGRVKAIAEHARAAGLTI